MGEIIDLKKAKDLPSKIHNADLNRIAREIDMENEAIRKIDNSWMSDEDKITARKKHQKAIESYTNNLDQLKTVSGVVALFDRKNYLKVQESAKPDGNAVIVQDKNKCYYLCGHGSEVKTVVDGKEKLSHEIADQDGNPRDTNEYIKELINKGKIPTNSTLRVTSCHVSALDILKEYPNGVKVEKITSDSGEVFDDHVTQKPILENNVAVLGSKKLVS